MVQINHWITKRIEKDSLRLFFQLVNDSPHQMQGSILLELRWFLGAYNVEVPLEKGIEKGLKGFFYIDVKKSVGEKWKSFEWVWVDGDNKCQGKGQKVAKFENLL